MKLLDPENKSIHGTAGRLAYEKTLLRALELSFPEEAGLDAGNHIYTRRQTLADKNIGDPCPLFGRPSRDQHDNSIRHGNLLVPSPQNFTAPRPCGSRNRISAVSAGYMM